MSIKRSGASAIVTYFALEIAKKLKNFHKNLLSSIILECGNLILLGLKIYFPLDF